MSKSFKVRTHTWEKGILVTKDHVFQDRQKALNFAQYAGSDHTKVTDSENRVIYQQKNYQQEKPNKKVKVKLHQETYA